ncbi:hypothetical protein ATK17_0478 [Branchiibius hedensis]|uniref:Uncharacterized protein n=1 Tax=Branchiibius hedensis TaxID=672460 RepID=A0A2Y8ZMP9_9MICO|nr:hypothetical protein [Branchiibius hedensis]PWJ24388.1 hypothetical protein ATK17_0478 [Branchiibius hedensis]SSA33205.1 hypothetical protein SAMN04489750_0478 [Branchiibius hedensis]
MNTARRLNERILRAMVARTHLSAGRQPERGDVPGWVLITIMTAGLVTALWKFAGPALTNMFSTAIHSVTGG